jgi:Nucleotidyltransferase domain
VLGSYADRNAVPGSDIDLFVVSKDRFRREDQALYRRIAEQCAILAGLRLDTGVVDEAHLGGRPALATSRILIYGEDVGDQIRPLHHDDIVRKAVSSAIFVLGELYDHASPLHVPLDYPDPQGEFYGFEREGMPAPRGWSGPGTKKLINAVSMVAGALVAIQSDHAVLCRADCVTMYRTYVGDHWSDFVEQVCSLRTPQSGYAIPKDSDERQRLRRLCAQIPAFTNHFLDRYKEHVLVQLNSATEVQVRWAAQELTSVRYPEPEVQHALERLWDRSDDDTLRDVLRSALHLQAQGKNTRYA